MRQIVPTVDAAKQVRISDFQSHLCAMSEPRVSFGKGLLVFSIFIQHVQPLTQANGCLFRLACAHKKGAVGLLWGVLASGVFVGRLGWPDVSLFGGVDMLGVCVTLLGGGY